LLNCPNVGFPPDPAIPKIAWKWEGEINRKLSLVRQRNSDARRMVRGPVPQSLGAPAATWMTSATSKVRKPSSSSGQGIVTESSLRGNRSNWNSPTISPVSATTIVTRTIVSARCRRADLTRPSRVGCFRSASRSCLGRCDDFRTSTSRSRDNRSSRTFCRAGWPR
jgi:hypothetical protein